MIASGLATQSAAQTTSFESDPSRFFIIMIPVVIIVLLMGIGYFLYPRYQKWQHDKRTTMPKTQVMMPASVQLHMDGGSGGPPPQNGKPRPKADQVLPPSRTPSATPSGSSNATPESSRTSSKAWLRPPPRPELNGFRLPNDLTSVRLQPNGAGAVPPQPNHFQLTVPETPPTAAALLPPVTPSYPLPPVQDGKGKQMNREEFSAFLRQQQQPPPPTRAVATARAPAPAPSPIVGAVVFETRAVVTPVKSQSMPQMSPTWPPRAEPQ